MEGKRVPLLSPFILDPVLRQSHPDYARNDLVTTSGNPLDLLEAGLRREVKGHVFPSRFREADRNFRVR